MAGCINIFSKRINDCHRKLSIFSLDQSNDISNYEAAHSNFMNVWSFGTSASPFTAMEVIPVPPECLRSFLTKYQQVKPSRFVSVFTSRASPTNLCLHVLLLDKITFSIIQVLTPWVRGQELFIVCVSFVYPLSNFGL